MRTLLILSVLLTCYTIRVSAQTTRILFLGNSYTAVNNLPLLVHDVAMGKGDTVIVNSNTPGGYTFEQHSVDSTSIARIYLQPWNYVVLQEQSQRPSFPPAQVALEVYPYATILDSMIHDNNACTETVFYMTWGRKNGDASNCAFYPPVCTYEGMQARLRESYMEMGLQNNATVSPVGAAFSYVRSLNPVFDLYNPDESHPSIYGSYLAACVFYATIFHKSPIGSTFISTISQQDADFLQNAAYVVVMDSLATWYQYGNIPYSSFTYTANGNTVHFTNQSLNAVSYSWNFGDNGTASGQNPNHTYAQSGSYVVTLTVNSACRSDVFKDTIQVGTTSLNDPMNDCRFYYDRNQKKIQINCGYTFENISLYDLQGRVVRNITTPLYSGTTGYDVQDLVNGIYLLKVEGGGYFKTMKIAITN